VSRADFAGTHCTDYPRLCDENVIIQVFSFASTVVRFATASATLACWKSLLRKTACDTLAGLLSSLGILLSMQLEMRASSLRPTLICVRLLLLRRKGKNPLWYDCGMKKPLTVSEAGRMGAKARAAKLSPERRKLIASAAAKVRAAKLSPERRREIALKAVQSRIQKARRT
jgi:hypothetical protein